MWCLLKWALNEALVRRFITLKNLLQCTHSHQALTSSTKLKHNVLQPLHLNTIKCRLLNTDYLDVFGHKNVTGRHTENQKPQHKHMSISL